MNGPGQPDGFYDEPRPLWQFLLGLVGFMAVGTVAMYSVGIIAGACVP